MEDPDFRARRAESRRAYMATNRERLNAQNRQRYATNPEFRTRSNAWNAKNGRRRKLMERYGISLEEFDHLLTEQRGACAICGRTFDRTPCIDHSHRTGKTRGLLCRKCNAGLGFYDDDPAFMGTAVAYLQYWKSKHAES